MTSPFICPENLGSLEMSIQLQWCWGAPLELHEFIQRKIQVLNGRIFPRCRILGGGGSMRRHYLHILKKLYLEKIWMDLDPTLKHTIWSSKGREH
jgi:hypothetical protein